MYYIVYLLIGSFKHSPTPVLFTDDPGDLASDNEAEEDKCLQKYETSENRIEGDGQIKTCGLQQVVS